jgi:hypothetical protein
MFLEMMGNNSGAKRFIRLAQNFEDDYYFPLYLLRLLE